MSAAWRSHSRETRPPARSAPLVGRSRVPPCARRDHDAPLAQEVPRSCNCTCRSVTTCAYAKSTTLYFRSTSVTVCPRMAAGKGKQGRNDSEPQASWPVTWLAVAEAVKEAAEDAAFAGEG